MKSPLKYLRLLLYKKCIYNELKVKYLKWVKDLLTENFLLFSIFLQ